MEVAQQKCRIEQKQDKIFVQYAEIVIKYHFSIDF